MCVFFNKNEINFRNFPENNNANVFIIHATIQVQQQAALKRPQCLFTLHSVGWGGWGVLDLK